MAEEIDLVVEIPDAHLVLVVVPRCMTPYVLSVAKIAKCLLNPAAASLSTAVTVFKIWVEATITLDLLNKEAMTGPTFQRIVAPHFLVAQVVVSKKMIANN